MHIKLPAFQRAVHENSRSKRFWKASSNIGEKIALIHSELSEAMEVYRDPARKLDEVWFRIGDSKPEGFGVELADAVIRILDLAEHTGNDIESLMVLKDNFNRTRPPMHGKKV